MEAKIVKNMDQKEYLSYPAMSNSKLWKLESSPAKFKSDIETEPSPPQTFGRRAHLLQLEQDRFLAETCQARKFDRRTKQGKEDFSLWEREHAHQEIISESDMEKLAGMRVALDNGDNTKAKALLSSGESEVSCFWEYENITFKCRFDKLDTNRRIITEYKTAQSIAEDKFSAAIINFGYDVALVLYTKAAQAYFDDDFEYRWVVQEKKPPYLLKVYRPSPEFYEIGERRLAKLISNYNFCVASDWQLPDGRFISDFIQTISPPTWAAYKT